MKNWMASKDFLCLTMLVNFHSSLKNIVEATEQTDKEIDTNSEICMSNFKLIAIYCG